MKTKDGRDVEVRDKRGVVLKEGDLIAVGMRVSNYGTIRIGTILEYLERPQQYGGTNCYIKVDWRVMDKIWDPKKPTNLTVITETNVNEHNRKRGTWWQAHEFIKVTLPDEETQM
jgi:hypothetical protein